MGIRLTKARDKGEILMGLRMDFSADENCATSGKRASKADI
jgi:hypothetical protein